MLSISENANWSTPGLKGRLKDGVYKGKLYTAMPLRFLTAGKNAAIASAVLTLLWMLIATAEHEIIDAIFVFIAAFIFIGYPLFVCFDPGKRIRITKQHLFVGMKRYDLKSCGRFWTWKSKPNRTNETLRFEYGNKQKEIRVRNSLKHSGNIRDALNNAVAAVQACAPQPAAPSLKTRLETRSAHF